jgi:hypothetical protein
VQYEKQKFSSRDRPTRRWTVDNRFRAQTLRLRIEALMSTGAYDDPGNVTLADFHDPGEFPDRAAQPGVLAELTTSTENTKVGPRSGRFSATNSTDTPLRSWCKAGKVFSPPANLSGHQALGVWVLGDGKGEVLNLQQTSPSHLSHAIADHYITVDFNGWRYFELVEPEGERYADFAWPYGNIYSIYRESIRPAHVETLSLWYNHLPPRQSVTCYLSPIRALPVMPATLRNPSITIGDMAITFLVEIETGQFLEFRGRDDCKLYGQKGEEIGDVRCQGDVPVLVSGENKIEFHCDGEEGVSQRATISIITHGKHFGNANRPD